MLSMQAILRFSKFRIAVSCRRHRQRIRIFRDSYYVKSGFRAREIIASILQSIRFKVHVVYNRCIRYYIYYRRLYPIEIILIFLFKSAIDDRSSSGMLSYN